MRVERNIFLLLMWKNFLLLGRKPVMTAFKILAPVFLAMIAVVVKYHSPGMHPQVVYPSYCAIQRPVDGNFCSRGSTSDGADEDSDYTPPEILNTFNLKVLELDYCPEDIPFVNKAMEGMKKYIPDVDSYSCSTFNGHVTQFNRSGSLIVGLEFVVDESEKRKDEIPSHIDLKLRFDSRLENAGSGNAELWMTYKDKTTTKDVRSGPRNEGLWVGEYTRRGFITLMGLVTHEIIKAHDPNFSFPEVRMRRFPYPSWTNELRRTQLLFVLVLVSGLMCMFQYITVVKDFVMEKQTHLKLAMKVIGVPHQLHWLARLTSANAIGIFLLMPICGLLSLPWYPVSTIVTANGTKKIEYKSAMMETPWYIIYVFHVAYLAAAITLGFAVASLFNRTIKAVILSILIFFLGFTPFVLNTVSEKPSFFKQLISCLCANSAMGMGWWTMLRKEYSGEGTRFDNIWEITEGTSCPLGYVILMLLVDAVVHLLFCMYVLAVFPNDESTPKPWYFLLTKKHWCPRRYPSELSPQRSKSDDRAVTLTEAAPANTPVGVNIMHLRKIFGGDIVAVRNLNMKLYEGQVTVLIGQKGAGKMTVMRLLGGLTLPTSGTATIYGHDLIKDMPKIRHALGYCSRNNAIYERLTVEDNLKFFSMLRGVSKADVKKDIDYYVDLLGLQKVRKKTPRNMTPQVKRKLSIAVAFCGRAKLVLLDEPTFGLKFADKREVWDMIQVLKHERTVLVNTQFIDEAEALGDRIAIMAEGELHCCGSLAFLKRKYGVGYYLHVRVRPTFNVNNLNRMLRFYIPKLDEPEVVVDDDVDEICEVHYTLPKSQSAVFGAMLADLEGKNGTQLGVLGYDVNVISMGEMFLKIITHQHHKAKQTVDDGLDRLRSTHRLGPRQPVRLVSGPPLVFNHFLAMFMKRIIIFARNLPNFVFMWLMIMFILWFAMSEPNKRRFATTLPSLGLTSNEEASLLGDLAGSALENNGDARKILDAAKGLNVRLVDNVMDEILKERGKSNLKFNNDGIRTAISLEASQEGNGIRLINWYSEDFYHAEGMAAAKGLSLIYNLATDGRSIHFHNHPLLVELRINKEELETLSRYLQVTVLLSLIMSLIAAYFSMFYVTERMSRSKYYQFISGVTVWVFLLVQFICDYAVYLVVSFILLLMLALFKRREFSSVEDMYQIFILLVSFGFAALPLTHLVSKAYTRPQSAILKMTTMNFLTGMLMFMLVWAFDSLKLQTLHRTKRIFMFWPYYTMIDAFQRYQKIRIQKRICQGVIRICRTRFTGYTDDCVRKYCSSSSLLGFTCCASDENFDRVSDFFALDKLGQHLLHLYGSGALLVVFVVLWEYRLLRHVGWTLVKKFTRTKPTPEHDEDEDVLRERIKISKYPRNGRRDYSLVLKDLTKNYGGNAVVNGLCAAVKKGECFGVFGPTGSGKSTTFELVTGEIRIGFGKVYVFNRLLSRRQMSLIRKQTSCCPQLDPLFDDMTVKETLVMYSLIKGVCLKDTILMARTLARDLEFTEHLNNKTKHLSRGNKRKVSVALSLIGKPKMIFMDEPTMGMDPRSKKVVWKVLANVRDRGVSILLTTHSKAEGEALCNRLAIMIQGTFNAMGSMAKLKEKFSKGYTITIRLKSCEDLETEMEAMNEIEEYFESTFKNVILIDKHLKKLTFFTEDEEMLCSDMFKEMERAKADYPIQEYTIGQSKLEQVFLYFTRRQGA